jgi:ribonuclease D
MIIQTNTELTTFCDSIQTLPTIFVDTEFVGEGRYYPDLGAIQVGAGEQAVLIDPIVVDDLSPLFAILANPAIEKVFHAATQDLIIFHHLMGQSVANVFDTQVAYGFMNQDDQISFGQLVEHTTGVWLKKSHSFTDWLHRPLSPRQIEYALEDVRYLAPAYEKLVADLQARGRLSWAQEEFTKFSDPARLAPADPEEVYLKIRGVDRLRGEELARIRALAAWRENTARELNLNPSRICMDVILTDLARHPRTSKEQLHELRGLRPNQIERFGDGLIDVLTQAAGTAPPVVKRSKPMPAELGPTVDFLVLCLRALAAEESVAYGLLANRADLEALAVHGERAKVPLMQGWRRIAAGEELLEALRGNVTICVMPETRQVHLDWHHDGDT